MPIETRRVNGRAHYRVPSAPAPQPAQEPAAAPKVGTASSAATDAATAPATILGEAEHPDDSDCVVPHCVPFVAITMKARLRS
jgi:hypothetical protein